LAKSTHAEQKQVRNLPPQLPLLGVVGAVVLECGLQLGPIDRVGGNREVGHLDAIDV